MIKTLTPEELMKVLSGGGLKPSIVREGIVKLAELDTDAILFSEGPSYQKWIRIPLEAIESVLYQSHFSPHDQPHPCVRLYLKCPDQNPAAALFAELLQATSGERNMLPHDDSTTPHALAVTQRIDIRFQPNGDGTLNCTGLGSFPCLGRPGLQYPTDITITTTDKHGTHWSNEFHCSMPYAILIWGQRGIYIHEWSFCRAAGGESAGCIHLCPGDAAQVYNWIVGRTRITIHYRW